VQLQCMQWSSILLSGRSMLIDNWSQQGAAILVYQSRMISYGKTWFINNSAVFGEAIYALIGNVTIDGDGSFIINSTVNDGVLLLSGNSKCYLGNSKCYLVPNSIICFMNNKAVQHGGAIYIDNINMASAQLALTHASEKLLCHGNGPKNSDCWHVNCMRPPRPLVHLYFIENTAEAGSILYWGTSDACYIPNVYIDLIHARGGQMLDTMAKIQNSDNTISTISSNPFTIYPCINNVQICSSSIVNRKAYPGQRFPVSLVAVGQRNVGVSSVIRNKFDEVGATFGDLQDVQPSNNTCTEPHNTVFSSREVETISLQIEGPCISLEQPLSIHVTLLEYPVGFMLFESECICDKLNGFKNIQTAATLLI